ncbi:MAG: hypothetical protein GY765_15770 [bacterium]|nr:hypothetical protein [bacterium]
MTLVITEKTECYQCNKKVGDSDDIVTFPAIIANTGDPLFQLTERVFHCDCFVKHPFFEKANSIFLKWEKNANSKICEICANKIASPDEYFGLFHFTYEENHPLFEFNFKKFHISCSKNWNRLSFLLKELEELQTSGVWGGHF